MNQTAKRHAPPNPTRPDDVEPVTCRGQKPEHRRLLTSQVLAGQPVSKVQLQSTGAAPPVFGATLDFRHGLLATGR